MRHTLLAPASLLHLFDEWRAILEELPEPNVLIVLPSTRSKTRQAGERIVARYRREGRDVIAISADRLAPKRRYERV